jgi:hypothetical protein
VCFAKTDRRERKCLVLQEGAPPLGGRITPSRHVTGHCGSRVRKPLRLMSNPFRPRCSNQRKLTRGGGSKSSNPRYQSQIESDVRSQINALRCQHLARCTIAGKFKDAADLRAAIKLAMQMLETR